MTIDANQLRTLRNRYEAHINSGDHRLWAGQEQLARDVIQFMGERDASGAIHDRGYFVRPTGTGKTVSLIDFAIGINTLPSGQSVLGNRRDQKRVLIQAPWNFLVDQWENELLGKKGEDGTRLPSKWADRIRPEHVGIYRASDSYEQKLEALQRPIVVITYDSARSLRTPPPPGEVNPPEREALHDALAPENFSAVLLDEVHDRPRGDATGAFIRNQYFGNCFVMGATATHLYKSGRTIGDYLFDGQVPIHETTFREAVNAREIAPMRNIIAEVDLNPEQINELQGITQAALTRARRQGHTEEDLDYTEKELERIVEITKRDEAAIRLLQRGSDPNTGKRYRDMKQVWYCASVNHAQRLADRINAAMRDENYAVAVHGTQDGEEQNEVLINYRDGEHRALTNCQLLVHGFDDPQAELCMQIVPSRSPNRVMQQGGRVMRLDPQNPNKIANIVTFVYPGIEQVIFGELANGFIMIPEGQGFATQQSASVPSERIWPEIEGLRVHVTTDQITLFRERRQAQQHARGLPTKGENMLTVEEMAKELNPRASREQLNHETSRLQQRLYEPLKAAYDMRQARQQYVGLNDTSPNGDQTLAVRGQPFPVSRIGHFNHNGQARFCIDRAAAALCRHALFGRVESARPELLSEKTVQRLLNIKDDQAFHTLMDQVKNAYLDRPAYTRTLEMKYNDTTAKIPLDTVGFFAQGQNRSNVGFFLWPDALSPLYQLAHQKTEKEANEWWETHPILPKLKTMQWLNQQDVSQELGVTPTVLNSVWRQIKQASVKAKPEEGEAFFFRPEATGERYMQCAYKKTVGQNAELCIDRSALEWIKSRIGMESQAQADTPRRSAGS